MWRASVVLAGLFAVSAASVGELHRCVGSAGVVYQDRPCGPGSVASKTIPVVMDAPKDETKARKSTAQSRERRSGATRPNASYVRPMRNDSLDRRRASCNIAKQRRDVALERLGLRRTFDDLRRLDDAVREACKGV